MKNLLLNYSRFIASGMMMGSLLSVPTWAMNEMPEEVLGKTFTHLPLQTLASIAPVSKSWKKISEEDKVWESRGFSSKKKCLEFPYATLEQQHLKALFKGGYLTGNEVFFWKLREPFEKPCGIFDRIAPATYPRSVNVEWTAQDIKRVENGSNLIQFTTNLIFIIEFMKMTHRFNPIPYTLTLKGSWLVEDTMEINNSI